ncbi:hypothetical protein Pcinc_006922 [Petrolisthes cinctipes]|uniref:Uncharacterized protein n=1 Tax=Petrolisthes cinctipes TaxID=88211 RepID=A0AAE1GBW7_PETCI|nr:hypothetical protein Pcinc_006922 [Petrolisthes cinctipes]
MTSGVSISQMVMPLAITFLQEEFGFRGATIITGALVFNCCAAALVLHPVDWHTNVHSSLSSTTTGSITNDPSLTKNPAERLGISYTHIQLYFLFFYCGYTRKK